MDNDWKKRLGVVYSTNPEFSYQRNEDEQQETPEASSQTLYVSLDKKNRKGKKVTLISGFKGKDTDLQILGKLLKSKCGTGGSIKEGNILIQGDVRDKILNILNSEGYKVKKSGG